jgi:hypothetical protein
LTSCGGWWSRAFGVAVLVRPATVGSVTTWLSSVIGIDRLRLEAWLLAAFLLAPSPFFACFDGCLGPQLVMPLILSWLPLLTIFSWLFPLTWVWHLVFMIPFLGVFVPLDSWLEPRLRGTWRTVTKRTVFVIVFVAYWGVVSRLWGLIPLEPRQTLLRQQG